MPNASAGIPPGSIVFGPKANCTLDVCPVEYSVYGYRPSLAANITFITLYAVAGSIHLYLGMHWRTRFFTGCMLVGCTCAVIGYIGRVLLWFNPFDFKAFMIQIICVTTGPVYYTAAIYVTLAAAIEYFSPSISRFPPRLLYWVFLPCDLFALVLQAAGGALSTQSSGTSQTGVNLALVGLAFQVVVIGIFCICFGDYLIRYFGRPGEHTTTIGRRMKFFFGFMAFAVLLIAVRCIYRCVELRQGYRGSLIKDESLFIGLEGVMVVASVFCLMVGHPGFVFKKNVGSESSEYVAEEGYALANAR